MLTIITRSGSNSHMASKVTHKDSSSIHLLITDLNSLDYEWKNKLRYVRIYFDTPTFDRITKDRAAKFVDMLSAIGGTMGLLTGFTIISSVEIVYHGVKIILKILQGKNNKK